MLRAKRATSPIGRPRVGSVSASVSVAREPREEGGLLVWEEVFAESGWERGEGPLLFGRRESPSRLQADLAAAGLAAQRLAFVDIETCGLADLPVFLVGILHAVPRGWRLVQLLARDPSGEGEMLSRSVDLFSRHPIWISFNGRSFDIPRLRRRCRRHEIEWPAAEAHRDLLSDVRRRWGSELPDCRLSTVESRLLALERRGGDVPGREVPERYRDYVESGERSWIDPVVEHNRRDVAALLALLCRLEAGRGPTARSPER